ncbi:MAG: hypothetical protein A2504_11340 [Bdellovibrionales bacterium RIFOXYD12_FULL_39_22]|nr:MAG: hypothetical protein A2385_09905 [Bdellovibrionales bacterium RIFOXYB1_FULL_39_21]OFZ44265.1 MAG: hypothetical protein A2485_07525 [Bdellovibrionales bacterium RIFOXYC12_FULL_39_17]OFZ46807.1 MAG: hypothetical protein A2404_04760 [Bdellovibrionales bacterium RIFOXYC1_FULL_39_130]OFZ75916.1 MAG: hypothetical protein A2560_02390 [Bdellovibrionales bacterium RIFOXYD1_FULL_39_84]OFZ95486.1 MAG: hypothetical protein A2504_11340 [Bdellovibrionales bacterium RIFOXYD12_FULL_39_22]HLE09775.1 3-
MRFYLVDRITEMELGKSAKGLKCWSLTEGIFNEHFPGYPIVPGVLAIESMAQLLGILLEKSHLANFGEEHESYAVLSIVHKAKFKSFLLPGDRAEMVGKLNTFDINHGNGVVDTFVDGKLISSCDLSFVLIPKSKMPNERLVDMRNEYFNILTQAESQRGQTIL